MNIEITTFADAQRGGATKFSQNWAAALPDAARSLIYTAGSPRTVIQMYHRGYVADLLAVMGERASTARYLEIGAGRGTTSMYLSARGFDVTMLDLAPAALDLAKACFAAQDIKCPTMILGDAEQTGLPAASYDCIFNIGLLEHFADPTKVLAETMRLLKPGGWTFNVVVPDIPPSRRLLSQSLFCPWRVPRTLWRTWKYRRSITEHGRDSTTVMRTAYSRNRYADWLRAQGADRVQCIPYNPYFELFRGSALEKLWQLPVYRAHFWLKRTLRQAPILRSWPATAQCDLLMGQKPSSA